MNVNEHAKRAGCEQKEIQGKEIIADFAYSLFMCIMRHAVVTVVLRESIGYSERQENLN